MSGVLEFDRHERTSAGVGSGRRSQEERSATTPQVINEATIGCLITLGYSGTTMSAVTNAAGLSRGAVTHHFNSKQEMLISAIDHLAVRVADELRFAGRDLDEASDRVPQVMRLLWQSFIGDLFSAALDMWVAARTDSALLAALVEAERSLGARNRVLLAEMFGPEIADAPGFDLALDTTFNLMRGIAVTGIVRQNRDREQLLVDGWARIFTMLTSTGSGAVAEPTKPAQPTSRLIRKQLP